MRLTKYPQSCILLEKDDGGRILVDPGIPALSAYAVDDFGPVDAVLYTHRHPDHLDTRVVGELVERGAAIYGNADVCSQLGQGEVRQVRDGDELGIAGFTVQVRDLDHMPMVDGSPGPPNTGYIFDGRCFHPGDGFQVDGLVVDTIAVPITGPSMSFRDAYRFVQQVGARRAVPIHYDVFVAAPELFASRCDIAEVVVLQHGAAVEI
jgi:L-ascorbate metabolism protein UlaG (beta-lactamase superfamily)